MRAGKVILAAAVVAAVAAFFLFDLGRYFTLEFVTTQQSAIEAFYRDHTALTVSIYAILYVVMAALSNTQLLFSMDVDERRSTKERVLGIPVGEGGGIAFPFMELDRAGEIGCCPLVRMGRVLSRCDPVGVRVLK